MMRLARPFGTAAALLLALGGCLELSSPGGGVFTVSEVRLPFPSVVVGDSLRDTLGVAQRLRIVGLTASGDTVDDVPTWVALDRGIRITAEGFVIGDSIRQGARIVGQVGGLQAPPVTLSVVPAPVEARTDQALRPVTNWTRPLGDTTHVASASMNVRVLAAGESSPGVSGWIVSFAILRQPAPTANGDPSVYLAESVNRRTSIDTTDANGNASRLVVLRPVGASTTGADTVIVQATVRYRGQQLSGSPIQFTVPFRRQ